MGVYCFRWRNGPWLKVGHYSRLNPWSRCARRGWRSVVCPDPALRAAPAADFDLVYWSPSLGRADERAVHRKFPDRFGEWIGTDKEAEVAAALRALDPTDLSHACDRDAAAATRRRL